jgi:transcriptional regulator with XRE-family HTH domain
LPFVRISLKSLRKKAYDFEPVSLGGHILRRRLVLGLSRPKAAAQMGVDDWTVLNWEKGRTSPPMKAFPAIVRFLGYEPFPPPKTLAERMLAARRRNGWTIQDAASRLGVDPTAWSTWERSGRVAWKRYRERLASFLSSALALKIQGTSSTDR